MLVGVANNDELKSFLVSKEFGGWMSKKETERAERVEKDRVESARQSRVKSERVESNRKFDEVLSGGVRSKGCCEPCNYHARTASGEYQPCKMGHEDSGPNKEICADCSETRYRPKK